ncbi:MAG: OsmC family peroxiredoxin [Actinobacteria bacterium]|nr:OsmC family peroxiredoxin [Actinomycetota bacterium]
MLTRTGGVVWRGSIARGGGQLTSGSSTLDGLTVTLPGRESEDGGETSPEELLAAAHATCFTMALGSILARGRTAPEMLTTDAHCSLDTTPGQRRITSIELRVRGQVPGIDAAGFAAAAAEAELMCPISKALAGNVEIRATTELDAPSPA